MNVQHSSKTDRWFTPPYIIEMVKEVLGEIDLDPASEEKANEVVGAREFYTQNALNETWVANKVFLNPYAQFKPEIKYKTSHLLLRKGIPDYLTYCPSQGCFLKKGIPVGSVDSEGDRDAGYRKISIHGKHVKEHQAVWFYHYKNIPEYIDHVDGDRTNNKISNLKAVDAVGNAKNNKVSRGRGGVSGIFNMPNGKYQVYAGGVSNGKRQYFGVHDNLEYAQLVERDASDYVHYLDQITTQEELFWEKLVYHFGRGHIGEAIFMAFSAELLAVSQKYGPKSLLDFTICIPKNRIRFIDPLSPGKSAPSHSNVIVYLGDNVDKFKQVFSRIGVCK